jgi:hypothetical protein
MTPPARGAPAGRCDADAKCLHVPCFQVQLDAAGPRPVHREANACAFHVPDVIETLRAWAGEHGVAEGQLTILAIEPAAGGRQPTREDQSDLRGFPFSTIPLNDMKRRGQQAGIGSRGTAPADPGHGGSVQARGPVPQRPGELGRE